LFLFFASLAVLDFHIQAIHRLLPDEEGYDQEGDGAVAEMFRKL
jgi:hypothetical protein